jgi:hypothetical protein
MLRALLPFERNQFISPRRNDFGQTTLLLEVKPQPFYQLEARTTKVLQIARIPGKLVWIASRDEWSHVPSTMHVVTTHPACEFHLPLCDARFDERLLSLTGSKFARGHFEIFGQLPQLPTGCGYGALTLSKLLCALRSSGLDLPNRLFELDDAPLHRFQVGALFRNIAVAGNDRLA